MTSCHLIPTWHEWNVNAGDVMVMWFASYVILVMSCWACVSFAHVHGAHAPSKCLSIQVAWHSHKPT